MDDVFSEFEKRVLEIETYMDFLKKIHSSTAKLKYSKSGKIQEEPIRNDLQKILRANFFILVYNLIESSIKKAIISIYDNLKKDSVSYSKAKTHYQKIWIREFIGNKSAPEKLSQAIHELANSILMSSVLEFDSKNIEVAGSIDARKIRELSDIYGFSLSSSSKAENNEMLTVKTQRNILAHGECSFMECGQDYTISDLLKIKKSAEKYLTGVLKDIRKFLSKKEYLALQETK